MNLVYKVSLILVLLFAVGATQLFAQELPRPSMARHESVGTLPSDYNAKLGPVLINVNASAEGEYVDNVTLANGPGVKSDFILTPQVGVTAAWPVTASNTLRLSTSLGYSKYLIHPEYDTGHILVAPDSILSFDLYIGDFKINFHDQFSYEQDPSTIGSVSNVVNFNRFQNIAGIGVIWDLNKLVLSLNYDHINFISESLQGIDGNDLNDPDNVSYSADQVSAAAAYSFTSTITGGLEGAASIRNYDHFDIQDNALSFGPFTRVEVTPNFKVSASGGVQIVTTESGNLTSAQVNQLNYVSPVYGAGTTTSYYANVTLDHRLNKYYTDRLSAGHEIQLDVFSQQSDVTYVDYTSSWKVNNSINMAFTLNFQDVSEPTGGNNLLASGSFDLFTAGVQLNFPVTKSVSGAILYQYNDKFNAAANDEYVQNRVGLLLNYHF